VDPRSLEIIKPYLRGQDLRRWSPKWTGTWVIFARRGIDIEKYPAIKSHLEKYRPKLEPKPSSWTETEWTGRKAGSYQWFELQDPVDYWEIFESKKILYPDITWRQNFCYDDSKAFPNNTTYVIPAEDNWIIGVLNSPISWWFAWREGQHAKDEAIRYFNTFVETFPIPIPSEEQRAECDALVGKLVELANTWQSAESSILDWLKVQHEITDPSTKLQDSVALDSDAFVAEVRKARGKKNPLTAAGLRCLREEYDRTIEPARLQSAEAMQLEPRLHDLVNAAYGLTTEEIRLMWDTAPPRMPIPRPPKV